MVATNVKSACLTNQWFRIKSATLSYPTISYKRFQKWNKMFYVKCIYHLS